jgi:peptidoglycan/xylan/chitin deacetylase (PgdA/CDA1 family)
MTAVPILMYHSVSATATPAFRRFAVHPRRFAAHMDHLAALGVRTLTIRELHALRSAGVPPPPRAVVLTFDDGFADFHTEAMPVLARHGFVATLYVVTGCVGGTSRWMQAEGESARRILSWSQLTEIAASGIECGAHSHTHPQLDLLPPADARSEVTVSRRVLVERLGEPVDSFAYPHGFHSRTVRALAREAGFRTGCAVSELVSGGYDVDDPFAVPRLTVTPDMDEAALSGLLDGTRPTRVRRRSTEAKRLVWQGLRRHAPEPVVSRVAAQLLEVGR